VSTFDKKLIAGCKESVISNSGTVQVIGEEAFGGISSLRSIYIPDSIITIEKKAFSGCSGLTGFEFPCHITTIEEEIFSDCLALNKITMRSGGTSPFKATKNCLINVNSKTLV
jgi:hypothetical protein